MPKATISIGGDVSVHGRQLLAQAMQRDGLPVAHDPDEGDHVDEPSVTDGVPDLSFYHAAITSADVEDVALVLAVWDDKDEIASAALNTVEMAHRLGLTVRLWQPSGFDPDYGETTSATITVRSRDTINGSALVDGTDGDPILHIRPEYLVSREAFAALYDEALKAKAISVFVTPPITLI